MASVPAPVRVLVVDDSAVIRGLLQRALREQPDIEVVGTASNGLLALEQIARTPADIVTLDVEMPHMDGITALPELLKRAPGVRVIMVSTLTERNAAISLKALALGASDYITKPTSKEEQDVQVFYRELLEKVRALAPQPEARISASSPPAPALRENEQAAKPVWAPTPKPASLPAAPMLATTVTYPKMPVRALAIGSSTGGPQALATVFKGLASRFPNVPVFITQHMPPTFTTILAENLKQLCGHPCAEGKDGETVMPATVYLAPGNYHMQPEKTADGKVVIRLNQNPQVNFCRPAVDPMLQSLLAIYGTGLLVVILTGMGSDGCNGAKEVAAAGGTVVAQNEETSVVWGMPRAVAEARICSAILPLDDVAAYIQKACA